MRPGAFIDRDGTINEEIEYLHEPDKVILIPGAAKAIRRLNILGWAVVCISNQSGVARGYFPIEAVYDVNKRLMALLANEMARIDKIYFCPHHPTEGNPPYLKICRCRKPAPEMLEKAATELDIDLNSSCLIGDSLSDIQAAQNLGLKSILVLTGHGNKTSKLIEAGNLKKPDHTCKDLSSAVDWIISQKNYKEVNKK